jgi:cytochrome c oxidase cbb3-type subunit 1
MGFLQYSFSQIVSALHPIYFTRAVGGIFFLAGAILMAYNFYKTIKYAPSNK